MLDGYNCQAGVYRDGLSYRRLTELTIEVVTWNESRLPRKTVYPDSRHPVVLKVLCKIFGSFLSCAFCVLCQQARCLLDAVNIGF
jgi:hypothetical protein